MGAPAVIPAFDPGSPDLQILEAFERVRAARAYAYSFDRSPDDPVREAEIEEADKRMSADEDQITDNVANTLPGVAARLMLVIPGLDASRWVDRGMMEHGFLALYHEIGHLDGHAQQIAYAVHELIEIEWEQSLAAYEKSAADFEMVLKLKCFVDTESFRLRHENQEPGAFWTDAAGLGDELETRFSNSAAIDRLVMTLTPDIAAYRRKAEVMIAEGYQQEAAAWLVRDANYLAGRIDPRTFPQEERA